MKAESIGLSVDKVRVSDKVAIESVRTKKTVLFWDHRPPYPSLYQKPSRKYRWGHAIAYPTAVTCEVHLLMRGVMLPSHINNSTFI